MTQCVMCEEAITNPVCPDCLSAGVEQWLLEHKELRLAMDVAAITDRNEDSNRAFHDANSVRCIKCHRSMALCAYCYTRDVFDVIKRSPKLLDQYLMLFNFDLEHMGWEQDARLIIGDYS